VRCLDVSVVTFRPDLPLLEKLIASLAEQAAGQNVSILIHDNSPDAETTSRIAALPLLQPGEGFVRVDVRHSPTNVGFGRGHNANAARCTAPFLFVLNQDCIVEPGALGQLLDFARNDERRVAAWELRQIPYEHPKAYDPVTLDVPWVSGAATLFRRSTFDAVGGFDPALFMYGEDVDLSWRLRAKGFRLRYLPKLDLRAWLRRRGVEADYREFRPPGKERASALLDAAHAASADMIVMGAWGHSRITELVLGGTTRHLFQQSDLPLLVAH